MIFELMYAAISTNTGLSQLKPRESGLVWKMHPSKRVFWPEKVAEETEDHWKIAFENQREIRQNGRIKYSILKNGNHLLV